MLRKNKFGDYTIYCDFCNDFCDTVESDSGAAWSEAVSDGWTREWENDRYVYKCPDCSSEGKPKKRKRNSKDER